ncbi:MXAN_6577-like cysteine-rich protein [Sorangium sp. So ce385]|uniref:MXAN_6577-like cysteine-rich protein n=1 Tax=Sorangium sp. So ce385 TaxID=3133308 RepID=UPI003F5BF571
MQKVKSRFRLAPTYTLLWLAAAVLASVASCSDGGPTTNVCVAPETQCDGVCVDTSTSSSHCGACGTTCSSGQVCSAGACVAVCESGQTLCGGTCVDVDTSEAHCGSCNNACEEGQTCQGGDCQGDCAGGRTECGDECVDTSSDPENCGECGAACEEGQACEDGACQDEGCSSGLADCDGACVNLSNNESHCGSCGTECTDDQTCVAGACRDGCGSGLTACGEACVDVQTDAANCGGCGTECSASQVCQSGMCACTVSPGQDLGSAVPQFANNTTVGQPNSYAPSCVSASSSERIYAFTAATAGVYSFDTSRSAYNVVLALLDATGCAEIACSADSSAAVTADLATGQTVYIVVDGADGEAGTFELAITRASAPSCPAGSFTGAVPQTITGSTVGRPNSVRPTVADGCPSSAASPDAGYSFTAPVAGDYVFDTYGSAFDTVVHVHDGTCRGTQLACSDDTLVDERSEATVTLAVGQTVVVVVDGSRDADEGAFRLTVRRAVPPPVCDDAGVCGDGSSGCVRCAFDGNCRDELAACTELDTCIIFMDCYRTCNRDADCEDACVAGDPESAALYNAALECAFCDECADSCSGDPEFTCR